MRSILLAALACGAVACAADSPHHHGSSPYAGQQSREIKALSETEVQDLLEGAGMGFAKAAELNGYPGPMHVMEHADALALTAAQREAIGRLLQRHKARARALGAEVVALERELDRQFATRTATPEGIGRTLQRIGQKAAELRAAHLEAHLETTALLTPSQIGRYTALRGY